MNRILTLPNINRNSITLSGVIHAAYKLLLAASDIYVLSLLLYFAAYWILGNDDWWYVNLMTNFIHLMLLPALIALPVAALRRRPARIALWSPPVLMFVILYGSLFLPGRGNTALESTTMIRAMTYNVAVNSVSSDDLIAAMRASDADIIALEEFGLELQAALKNELLEEYPYRIMAGEFIGGKGLFSRYPIEDYDIIELDFIDRSDIEARLNVNGKTLTVHVVHPPHPNFQSNGRLFGDNPGTLSIIKRIIEHMNTDEPTIIMGDFNMTDQNDHYDLLKSAGLIDSFRTVGRGFGATFPAKFSPVPLVRIDYIWSTDHFMPLTSHVGTDAGSDHLPLISELAWIDD